jgi:hypothetical protein
VDIGAVAVTLETGSLLTLETGALVDVEAAVGLTNRGAISMPGVTLGVTGGLFNGAGGTITGYGDIAADVTNGNEATYQADTQVVGDYLNNGTTTIEHGTLTILGTLIDNGTTIGAGGGGAAPVGTGGLSVLGNYLAGAASSLHMPPQATVAVGGYADVAINDNLRYDMADAELRLVGLGEGTQHLELMSADLGPVPAGLDRMVAGNYPIGTMRVGPTPTVVSLVDNRDNDGQGQVPCEAIYVQSLVVEAGATLNTNGCPVYYLTAQVDGTVDDPANLQQINVTPPCPWDLDGDSVVGITDFLILLAQWGTNPGGPPDFNGDLTVGITDFLELLANWGLCPP